MVAGPRVVHEHIQTAEQLHGGVDEPLHLRVVGDVGGDGVHGPALLGHLGDDAGVEVGVAPAEDDLGAGVGDRRHLGLAEAAVAAGDQGASALQGELGEHGRFLSSGGTWTWVTRAG